MPYLYVDLADISDEDIRIEYENRDLGPGNWIDNVDDQVLIDEVEQRQLDLNTHITDAIAPLVQAIRCGELTIEGKLASRLIDVLYEITNKVV